MGKGRIFSGSATPAPIARGRTPALSTFGGSVLFLHTPFDVKRPTLTSHILRRGLFLEGQPHSRPKGCSPAFPNFGGSSLFMPTPLTQNDQIRRGNTREGRISWGQPRDPIPRDGAAHNAAFPNFWVPPNSAGVETHG